MNMEVTFKLEWRDVSFEIVDGYVHIGISSRNDGGDNLFVLTRREFYQMQFAFNEFAVEFNEFVDKQFKKH